MEAVIGLKEACRMIENGELSAAELLTQCSKRADSVEPILKAFTKRESLSNLIAQSGSGPLMGIPVAVKDIIETKDLSTTYGSSIYKDHTPKEDAPIIKRIRSLGGVVFGKTITTEFAWRHPGQTTNPWNSRHTPGGSSSGSAAAVACGIVPLAIGSQTVGSIVRPAAFCGIVGFKASYGAIPKDGVHPVADSLDHIGFFTRSVDDAALAFNLLKNIDQLEHGAILLPNAELDSSSYFSETKKPRFALLKTPFDHLISEDQSRALQLAKDQLLLAGATIDELELPQTYWDGIDALHVVMACEAAVTHEDHLKSHFDQLSVHIKELGSRGSAHLAGDYIRAKKLQNKLRNSVGQIFEKYDSILSAPALGEAPEGLDSTGDPIFCALWSFLGVPSIALPFLTTSNGLPIGIQLVGNYKEDSKLLNIAKFTEQHLRSHPLSIANKDKIVIPKMV